MIRVLADSPRDARRIAAAVGEKAKIVKDADSFTNGDDRVVCWRRCRLTGYWRLSWSSICSRHGPMTPGTGSNVGSRKAQTGFGQPCTDFVKDSPMSYLPTDHWRLHFRTT